MLRDPDAVFARMRHAGAVFLGAFCPEAVGDYVAGPNHVLPTGRTARFASGLSVFDFLKRTTWVAADADALARVGPAAVALAEAEGLHAHARSIALRSGRSLMPARGCGPSKRSLCNQSFGSDGQRPLAGRLTLPAPRSCSARNQAIS